MGAPSYKGLSPASEKASKVKRRVRAQDTKAEVFLRRALWHGGYRYRKNYNGVPGKPDIAFVNDRLAVFVDGDFWHGREWSTQRERLSKRHNARYWISKIEYNRRRDSEINAALKDMGWHVLRLWQTEVEKDPDAAAERTLRTLRRIRSGNT